MKKQNLKSRNVLLHAMICSLMVLLLAGCKQGGDKWVAGEAARVEQEELIALQAERDSVIRSMQETFTDIDAALETIRSKEASLREFASDEEVPGLARDRVVRDLRVINALIDDNRKKITHLQSELGKVTLSAVDFEKKAAAYEAGNRELSDQMLALSKMVEAKNSEIENLNADIMVMSSNLLTVNELMKIQGERIEMQSVEMNRVYYVKGTSQELKKAGIIRTDPNPIRQVAYGREINGEFDNKDFIPLDKRIETLIPLFAKKGKLITPHPDGSWKWVKPEDDDNVILEITDPEKFWKLSNYLVIQIVR